MSNVPIDPVILNYPLNDRNFDYNHQELTTIQLLAKIIPKVNEVVVETNLVDGKIAEKENSSNITSNRKLSAKGNFTGTVDGVAANRVIGNIEDNNNKITYLASQFSGGQTGLVVDGGFFENSAISKNFDGGVF